MLVAGKVSVVQTVAGSVRKTVRANGLAFSYLEWGDRASPPLVLLHGLTGHAHTWDHMAPELARSYHVLAPDQRGHGETEHADTYATADFVADVDALADAWSIASFDLMGLSMGGHNALAYAARHPDRVTRLVAIDIPAKMDRKRAPNWDVISRLAATGHKRYATFEEAFIDARAANATAPDANLRYRTHHNVVVMPDGALMLRYDPKCPARWQPADLSAEISRIRCPVLLVRGELTTVLPRATADAMCAAIDRCELVEIPRSGHSVPTDRPEGLTPVVRDWLARTNP
jgi:pimeloyl-ACP methyl ester carboxylesterase